MILAVMYANKEVAVKPKENFLDALEGLNFFSGFIASSLHAYIVARVILYLN